MTLVVMSLTRGVWIGDSGTHGYLCHGSWRLIDRGGLGTGPFSASRVQRVRGHISANVLSRFSTPASLRARSILLSVSSRPSSATLSKIPGDTVLPAIA